MSKSFIRIAGADLETTGFHYDKDDKITEFCFDIHDFDLATKTFTHRKTWGSLVNPERGIPQKVQDLTNIRPIDVALKPNFKHFAPGIEKLMNTVDIFVAHNFEFDGPFLHYEMTKAGYELNTDCEPFCTMQAGRFAKPLGEVPKLTDLCWALEVEFDDTVAHRADYDTSKMMECFIKGVKTGVFEPELLKGKL